MILNEQTIVVVRDDSSGRLGRLSHGFGPGIGFEAGRGLDTAGTVMFDIRFLRPTRLHNE